MSALGEHLWALSLEIVDLGQGAFFALEIAEHVEDGADGLALSLNFFEEVEEVAGHEKSLHSADHVALCVFVGDSSEQRFFFLVYLMQPDVSGCDFPRPLAPKIMPSCFSFILQFAQLHLVQQSINP